MNVNCGMTDVYKSPDGKYICSVCKKEMENGYIETVRKFVGEKHADSIDKRAKPKEQA